ncbi:PREDICTED: sorting nexin-3 [Acanthisitta chloris]|uniref:sorting nexin-3 n=1 Tax=Acanthisitta chloris TaxID=57068 RepID=UPI0004F0CDC6|nr:PREDICTED: sorting nexin-3 [Acanthisitta chloris]
MGFVLGPGTGHGGGYRPGAKTMQLGNGEVAAYVKSGRKQTTGKVSAITVDCWNQFLVTNLPIFKLKESTVRRRYSDFEWLRNELERESKVVVPPLPGKALLRQLPFRGDDGIFDDSFIEERKQALEQFINKVAGHPLAQNERCLHMFLQDEVIDKNYTPSKIRHT